MEILCKILGSIDDSANEVDEFIDVFKLPIEYIDKKVLIKENIIHDMELLEFNNEKNDNSNNILVNNYILSPENIKQNLYYVLLNPETNTDKILANRWCKYYTNDKLYLKDTQYLLEHFKNIETSEVSSNVYLTKEKADDISGAVQKLNEESADIFSVVENKERLCNELYRDCNNIIYDNAFINRYEYIGLPFMKKYNEDKHIMHFWTINNLMTPIFNLSLPIFLILAPFFLIKLQGHKLTINNYLKYLKSCVSNNAVGNILFNFGSADSSTRIFMIFSLILYIYQFYNSIVDTIKYFKNLKYINELLINLQTFITFSINNIKNLYNFTYKLETYKEFTISLMNNLKILEEYYVEIKNITTYRLKFSKLYELGNIMKSFYKINKDKILISALYFSFNCNSYIDSINNIQKLIKENYINKCIFTDKTEFTNAYYGHMLNFNTEIVKNSYKLDNNLLLTGPNAGGKTTILKSTLFNIILCQQIGYGFFDSAKIKLYDFIHCYINIPETSSRDSLFQAEAKLCKNILDVVEENPHSNHLCLFDEIYSGTNPEDAVDAGFKYITYLNNFKNINIVLTTHYFKLCKKLSENKINKNYHMDIEKNDDNIIFKYKLKKGISKIKGGSKILKDLSYPETFSK